MASKGANVTALCALSRHADVVVLTCSTLGPSIERIAPDIQVPILRADEALAATAVRHGGKIVVLCAIETTLEPTTRLFHKAAQQSNAEVDVQLVPGAWHQFKAGEYQDLPEELKKEVLAFADINVAWLAAVLTDIGNGNATDHERRARAIYTAIAGAQLIARTRIDIGLYDELVQSYQDAGLIPA